MDFISYVQQILVNQLPEIISGYTGDMLVSSLSEMERAVKQMSQALGGEVLAQWLAAQVPKYPEDERVCPHCGEPARYARWRKGVSITLLGRVVYRRPYYCCEQCHRGHYPLDEALDIQPGQMSHEVRQMAALVGIQTSFATSRDILARTALLELSANSIRKACQMVGQAVMQQEDQWIHTSQDFEAQRTHQRSADKPEHLYGSLDGFMAHLEGEWHEMKAGTWWTTHQSTSGEVVADNICYYTDWLPASQFTELVWATGFQQLADQAQSVIFVADGAEWIWRMVEQHFPQAVQIVDWYHGLSYVRAVAQSAFCQDAQAREDWFEQQRQHLWDGRLSLVFANCRRLAPFAPDAVHKTLTYFAHNRLRMRYDRFRSAGYQIGSGTMESGCKQLGLGRLKIAGAQWRGYGARLVAKARAAYLSGQWDDLNRSDPPLPLVA